MGAALCRRLLAAGAVVHGTVRTRPAPEGVVAWPCALEHPPWLDEVLQASDPELIVHLASPIDLSRGPRTLDAIWAPIVGATEQIAAYCLSGDRRLVHVGTCEEYGDVGVPYSEATPCRPVCPYGVAKLAATATVLGRVSRGLRANVVRPFLTFGPGMPSRGLLGGALAAARAGTRFEMTHGDQTREVNYVDDQVEGLVRACSDAAVGTLLNLGGGPEVSVRALAGAVFDAVGADAGLIDAGARPDRPGERPRFCGDHTRANKVLGSWSRTPLVDALRVTASVPSTQTRLAEVRVEPVARFEDRRGALIKAWPNTLSGEVYVITCAPGQRRGDHRHHRMGEWFTALAGDGVVEVEGLPTPLALSGQRVFVPAGRAHAVVNRGADTLLVAAFAGRPHDPSDVEAARP